MSYEDFFVYSLEISPVFINLIRFRLYISELYIYINREANIINFFTEGT